MRIAAHSCGFLFSHARYRYKWTDSGIETFIIQSAYLQSCSPLSAQIESRMALLRSVLILLLVVVFALSAQADDILFIGNSFTFGAMAPLVEKNGGVPKLFEAIALAKGRQVATFAVTAGGKDWSYHLAQPATDKALGSRTWTWVVLQDFSTRPTRAGDVKQFLQDGETFSARIAQNSPKAGIVLFETWARPPGKFYQTKPGNVFAGPEQMMSDLHESYGRLRDNLAAENKNRAARVALVGTAFATVKARYPEIKLDAIDLHHATADGYYLAALVIYETIYGDSVKGAPATFYQGKLTIPADDAAKLQAVADEVAGGAGK